MTSKLFLILKVGHTNITDSTAYIKEVENGKDIKTGFNRAMLTKRTGISIPYYAYC